MTHEILLFKDNIYESKKEKITNGKKRYRNEWKTRTNDHFLSFTEEYLSYIGYFKKT